MRALVQRVTRAKVTVRDGGSEIVVGQIGAGLCVDEGAGRLRADMAVELVNDGPVTVLIET